MAITRPKFFLLVVGNEKTLSQSEVWKNMIQYAKGPESEARYVPVPSSYNYETHLDLSALISSTLASSGPSIDPNNQMTI